MIFAKARGAEDRDARTVKVETFETAQKLEKNRDDAFEVLVVRARPAQEGFLSAFDLAEKGILGTAGLALFSHIPTIYQTNVD